jgi:hypothetical protein
MPDNRDPDVLVSDAPVSEEEREAQDRADAGRPPTPEEEAAADRSKDAAAGVEKPYRDMTERGANVKGEGQIE